MRALLVVRADPLEQPTSYDPLDAYSAPILRFLAEKWAETGKPDWLDLFVIDNGFTDEELANEFETLNDKLASAYNRAMFVVSNTDVPYMRRMSSLLRPSLIQERAKGSIPDKVGVVKKWLDMLEATHKPCLEKA